MNTKEKGFVFRLLAATADRLSGAAAVERNLQTNKQKSKSRQTKKITFKMYRSRWGKKLLSTCAGLDAGSSYFQNVRV